MFDVTAIGELLIDFTPSGQTPRGDLLFARIAGGAPANVLAAVSKLGGKTAFIGKVGKDAFGAFLRESLEKAGICAKGLVETSACPTTLAFVQLDSKGDRSFTFYRKPGADILLESREVSLELIQNCRIFHFGSVSLTDEPSRSATLDAVRYARSLGKLISYDPNYRPFLWESSEAAVPYMLEGLSLADVVKVSEEELELLSGSRDPEEGSLRLLEKGCTLVLVSMGEKGAFYRCGSLWGYRPTYQVHTIDTNGAGDAFFGAVLHRLSALSREEITRLSAEALEEILSYGNAAGSITTTRHGSIPALPTEEEILHCRETFPLLT